MKGLPIIIAFAAGCVLGVALHMQTSGGQSGGPDQWTYQPAEGESPVDPRRISYGIGYRMGSGFAQQGMSENMDTDALELGLEDGLSGTDAQITQAELQSDMQTFSMWMQQRMMADREAEKEKNENAGILFMKDFREQDGVVELPNGIAYRIIAEGTGPTPSESDTVVADYEGRLVSGKVFDSSMEKGEPVTFPLNRVIPGWRETLVLMPEGSTWEVAIPPELGYGERGAGALIGPNETLIFKIKLVEIKPADSGEMSR